jgi:multisubunit Na+/H+ antiporter MnhE subunit
VFAPGHTDFCPRYGAIRIDLALTAVSVGAPFPIMRRILSQSVLLTWASQLGFWLIFADNAGFREVIIGAAAAALTTFFVFLFISRSGETFKLSDRHLAQVIHVPESLFSDTWILLRVIAMRLIGRKVPGGIVAVHFNFGGDDSASRGRRALAITFLTFAPNNLVLGILQQPQILFFHTVIPQPLPSFMKNMGADPDYGR